MRIFTQQPKEAQPAPSARLTKRLPADHEQGREMHPGLHLQRRLGNQAAQRLLQTRAGEPESTASGVSASSQTMGAGETALHSTSAGTLQARLTVSQPQDALEQEADHVAAQVMRMADPQRAIPGAESLARQRTQATGEHERVHARRSGSGDIADSSATALVQQALHSPGQPLGAEARDFFEPRFGHDFGQVRVHTGADAEQSAHAIDAAAYTAGADIVFAKGRYAPETPEGKELLAHELTHTIQQGLQAQAPASVQRQPRQKAARPPADALLKSLKALVSTKVAEYADYKAAISRSTAEEKKFALLDKALLTSMKPLLPGLSFPRCLEALGRRAPTFADLQKNSVVATALADAWKASDVGKKDLVSQAHEEGGWVLMNLIDGSLSVQRAQAVGTDFLKVEPFPEAEDSIVVALFHTHPTLVKKPGPSPADKTQDKRRGVPNLVAASTPGNADVFKVFLSGPTARKHLASDTKIPGPSGGIGP